MSIYKVSMVIFLSLIALQAFGAFQNNFLTGIAALVAAVSLAMGA